MRMLTCCQLLIVTVSISGAARAADDAEAHYRRGVELGEAAREASIFRKFTLAREAREEFERAVQLDPNYIEARFALIEFHMLAPAFLGGGEDKAIAQANEIKKRDAIDGHRAFAMIYQHQKKQDLARQEYVAAVKERPNSPKAHFWLGVSYLPEKNYKAAASEFNAAVRLDPSYM